MSLYATIVGPGQYRLSNAGQRVLLGLNYPVRASWYGAGPSATAAENTTAIQAAIDAVIAAGGGRVVLDEPGTWSIAVAGTNPYQASTQYCFDITGSDVTVEIKEGVTLQLAASQQTDAGGFVFGFVYRNRSRVRLAGKGIFDLNSQNQSGWTGGYNQQSGGHVNGYATEAGGGIHDCTVDDLTLLNTFGNPVNLGNLGASSQAINTRCHVRNTVCRVFGEGIQFIGIEAGSIVGNTVVDAGTSLGDALELSNCLDIQVLDNIVQGNGSSSTPGSALDVFGSKRCVVSGNIFDSYNDTLGLDNGPGSSTVDGNTFSGNVFRNNRTGTSLAAGANLFCGNQWVNNGTTGANIQALNTTATSKTRFVGDKFYNCGTNFIEAGQVDFEGCEADAGSSDFFYVNQEAGYSPTLRWTGGRINNRTSGGAAIAVQSIAATDFAPSVKFFGADLTGNAAGVDRIVNTGSLRNVFYDHACTLDSDATNSPDTQASALIDATLEARQALTTTQRNKSLVTRSVIARVADLSGTPGNVTLSVGTVAGSYIDIATSQTIAPTAVGQVFRLTLATGVTPAANAAVYVNVSSAGSTTCRLVVSLDGEYQSEFYDTTTAINTTTVPTLALYLARTGDYYTDAGTTPAGYGDSVYRWDTAAPGLPRADQASASERPVRRSLGIELVDATTEMDLSASVTLTGDFTIYVTGYVASGTSKWFPLGHAGDNSAILFSYGGTNYVFAGASSVDVSWATIGITPSSQQLAARIRRTSNTVYLKVTGAAEVNLGTLAGTMTLSRVGNWTAVDPSSNTANRTSSVVICNTHLTPDGTQDELVKARLTYLDGVAF
jgi:hypothetical protein